MANVAAFYTDDDDRVEKHAWLDGWPGPRSRRRRRLRDFLADGGPASVTHIRGRRWDRLAAVKRRVAREPFRHNQNVRRPSAATQRPGSSSCCPGPSSRRGMIGAMDPIPPHPPMPAEVARRVRVVSGVPWRRLFGYLRPHAGPFCARAGRAALWARAGASVPLVVAGL